MKNKNNINSMLITDAYKLNHILMYPEGTEYVYSNFIPRSGKYMGNIDSCVVFGIQYLIKEYLINHFNENFFALSENEAVENYEKFLNSFLGKDPANVLGSEHIRSLHKLGYLPIEIRALEEGTKCPIGMPYFTIINTLPEFFWITNYLETLISNVLWLPAVSATTASIYKKELIKHLIKTGGMECCEPEFLIHDFSMRGMAGIDGTISSGMAHLTSFLGSESIPAVVKAAEIYNDSNLDGVSLGIPASEHSIECSNANFGGFEEGFKVDERAYIRRMLDQFPEGNLSIVCDGFDFYNFVSIICTEFKDEIKNRNGRVVIRPDSGKPEDIIAGSIPKYSEEEYCLSPYSKRFEVDKNGDIYYFIYEGDDKVWIVPSMEEQGVYEILWNTFGGKINNKGYKVLNPCIGVIYGDSITPERQKEIYRRLENKGFSATNLVLGIGSYTYQYKTRDSLGLAMKATWCKIKGQGKELFKDPKTAIGMPKKSLRGLLGITSLNGGNTYKCWTISEEDYNKNVVSDGFGNVFKDWLQPVFKDGKLLRETTLFKIRENINSFIKEEIKQEGLLK